MKHWDRFQDYAALVRRFYCDRDTEDLWAPLQAAGAHGRIFPNTRALEWSPNADFVMDKLSMFISPALRELHISWTSSITPTELVVLLEDIAVVETHNLEPKRVVGLEALHINWLQKEEGENVGGAITSLLKLCSRLKHLCIRPITQDSIEILPSFLNLVYLCVGLGGDFIRTNYLLPSLEEIGIQWINAKSESCALNLLESIAAPRLKKVSLYCFPSVVSRDHLLQGWRNLTLSIDEILFSTKDVLGSGFPRGGLGVVSIATFEPILKMRKMKRFRIQGYRMELSIHALRTIALSWPLLEIIEIDNPTTWIHPTYFRPFAETCMNIREIRIPWKLNGFDEVDEIPTYIRRIRHAVDIYTWGWSGWTYEEDTLYLVAAVLCAFFVNPCMKAAVEFTPVHGNLEKGIQILENVKAMHNNTTNN